MNREEAINIMSQMIKDEEGFLSDDTVEAHKMALKALEQMPKILETLDFAIDASNGETNYFVGFRNGLRYSKSLIDGKEPQFEHCTEQETKTGYWIGIDGKPSHLQDGLTTESVWCSLCGEWLTASDEYSCDGKFCPNCGAKMIEPKERSDKV